MNRHLIDRPRGDDSVRRARAFLEIARSQLPSRAALLLQRRPAEVPAAVRQFVNIARGRLA